MDCHVVATLVKKGDAKIGWFKMFISLGVWATSRDTFLQSLDVQSCLD